MQFLRNRPIKQKITAITLFTILVVSLLSSTAFVVIESGRARFAIIDEMKTIAGIVADNSTAALVFDDPSSAEETLSALKAKTDIIGAAILRRDGSLFATYTADSSDYRPLDRQAAQERPLIATSSGDKMASEDGLNGVRFHDGLLELAAPILLDGDVVGTLVLRSNLDQIASSLWTYILIVLAVMVVSLGIAFVLISRMQRVISTPIERLRMTIETVAANQDYTVRAESHGRDELGSVIDGLNHMLAQIQRHEEVQRKAHQQAEAANRAKSEFLANMSHELRTPLNAILGFSEILMREMVGPLGQPRYREYAADIHDSGRHLLAVINDILDLSKIEAGRVELVDGEIEVGPLAEKTLRLLADRAEQAEIEIRLLTEPNLPILIADERLVRQALLNLLSNAVKFTPRGGRVEVCLSLAADGAFCMRVRDTGIGIAESDMKRVLTPFGQVESALTRNYQGTGLGLPLTKSFVEMHGGSLELKSSLGAGTEVTLRFPAERAQPQPESKRSVSKPALSA